MTTRFSNVIAFDDAPFSFDQEDKVKIVGTVFAGKRFDGLVIGEIEKDGSDATSVISKLISESKFAEHVQLVMLQGITMAGFNVINTIELNENLKLPVLVVSRTLPDQDSIRDALIKNIPDGKTKWVAIQKAGDPEVIENVYTQRTGISREDAQNVIRKFAIHSVVPEPIRMAHLIAGALVENISRGRV